MPTGKAPILARERMTDAQSPKSVLSAQRLPCCSASKQDKWKPVATPELQGSVQPARPPPSLCLSAGPAPLWWPGFGEAAALGALLAPLWRVEPGDALTTCRRVGAEPTAAPAGSPKASDWPGQ